MSEFTMTTKDVDKADRLMAKFIAMVVCNAMEDFHVRHLSDAQMRELNPIIRNAIFTALHVAYRCTDSAVDQAYYDYHSSMIPRYWEEPQLLDGYVATLKGWGKPWQPE